MTSLFEARGRSVVVASSLLFAGVGCGGAANPPAVQESAALSAVDRSASENGSGAAATFSTQGRIDHDNLFFKSVGTNGRSCASCHVQEEGWSIVPASLRRRFASSGGTDPVFRPNDGANSPSADVSTVASRRQAYSMLLTRGLIRVGMGIPADAEFELAAVDDPYGHASASDLSLFRRPLPSTNLTFLSAVMWDGRETAPGATLRADLAQQASDATEGHAQGAAPLTAAQREEIVAFETSLFTAQARDDEAGWLDSLGGRGGATKLSAVPFHLGINDTLGNDPFGAPFDPVAMRLYASWLGLDGGSERTEARRSIARGEALFNSKPIAISGVRGLNDALGVPTLAGTCTTCHNTPNVGDHSVSLPLDLGLTDESRRTADMPLYTLRNKATGELYRTTDPGRALVTGKWRDRSRFKGPVLRALAARAPYFHNGSARDLNAVLDFYTDRFNVIFTAGERRDLVAFLGAL